MIIRGASSWKHIFYCYLLFFAIFHQYIYEVNSFLSHFRHLQFLKVKIQKEIRFNDLSFQLLAFKPYYVNQISTKVPFLVHEKEKEIRGTLEAWSQGTEPFNRTYFELLLKQKKIFPNVNGIDISDVKHIYGTKGSEVKKLQRKFAPIHMYVNRGTDENPVYVKASASRGEVNDKLMLQNLIDNGDAFTNLTQLMEYEKEETNELKLTRLVNSKFEIMSKPWLNWARYRMRKGKYTTKMAIVETLSPHNGMPDFFATDIGINRPAGYIGTLYENDEALETPDNVKLSDPIPIPWPAMQEIPWHVRWPAPHPFINPPILWMAKMGFFDKTVLKRYPNLKEDDNPEPLEKDPDNSTIVAGPYMLSKDAVRIAKYGTHGAERDESIQRHVGFWVQEPFNVPFYEPDYPATNMNGSDKFPYDPILYDMMGLRHPIEDIVKIKEEITDEEIQEEAERMKKIKALGIELPDTSRTSMSEEEDKEIYDRVYPMLEKSMGPFLDRYGSLRNDIYNHSKENYYYSDFRNQTGLPEEYLTEEIKAKLPKEGYFIIKYKENPVPGIDNIIMKVPNVWPIHYIVWQEYQEERLPLPIEKIKKLKDYKFKEQKSLLKRYNPKYRHFDDDDIVDKDIQLQEMEKVIEGYELEKTFSDEFYEKLAKVLIKEDKAKNFNLTPTKKGEEKTYTSYTPYAEGMNITFQDAVAAVSARNETERSALDEELEGMSEHESTSDYEYYDPIDVNATSLLDNYEIPYFPDPVLTNFMELQTFYEDNEDTRGERDRNRFRLRFREKLEEFWKNLDTPLFGVETVARGYAKLLAKDRLNQRIEAEKEKNMTAEERLNQPPKHTKLGTPIYKEVEEPTEEEKRLLLKYRDTMLERAKEYEEDDPFDEDDDDEDYDDEDDDEEEEDEDDKKDRSKPKEKMGKKEVDPEEEKMIAVARKFGTNIYDDNDVRDPYEEVDYIEMDEKIEGEDDYEEDEEGVEYETRPELISSMETPQVIGQLYGYRRKQKPVPSETTTPPVEAMTTSLNTTNSTGTVASVDSATMITNNTTTAANATTANTTAPSNSSLPVDQKPMELLRKSVNQ